MVWRLAVVALFSTAVALVAAIAQAPQRPALGPPAAHAPEAKQTCLKCHGYPPVSEILRTPHAIKGDPHAPFARDGCETCHGPSQQHLANPAVPPTLVFGGPRVSPVMARNEVCLACHESHGRLNWVGSKHDREGIACTDCHTAHAAKDPVLVRATEPNTCFTCHARIRAQTFEYSHHPIREGLVSCSDCHNLHGSFSADTKMLKEFTVNQTCYNCHADKRGPLLWEHQPVRENCMTCHTAHGSNQPRLQIEQTNFLCSSCHSAIGANHSGGAFGGRSAIPFRGPGSTFTNSALANQRACTNCHSQVHGSNSPAGAYFFR